MTQIIMVGAPECPLCYKPMREIVTPKGIVYACVNSTCMVCINKHDPACGKWRDHEENAPDCPLCGNKMRWFFRISDGYKKIQCPACTSKGRQADIQVGKVEDMSPQSQQAWSIDPEEL